ncbi:hypothetical protein QP999_09345 [Corynebacterium sp. MSK004]|uniref:hypothetical protein n=1 Tax=Corynebacterium sp. MSK004 TaxID=3050186 RepID=UPI00254A84E9|nr:hypothetical protein [Corynebacterium sp. MSK004]MDK8898138.1 hypothetical protein [Corynebacterium sp. MSK004]
MTDDPRAAVQQRIANDYQRDTDTMRGQRDGVVVTPVEIVDFQVRAVIHQLAAQGYTLADPEVRITDPFGGTGIYLARLMQLAGLSPDQLDDLYHHRMLMVEIDPEACTIADKNLRAVYQQETGREARHSIVHNLDTFTLGDEIWGLTHEGSGM